MKNKKPSLIIISGGSEIVSLAVAEAAWSASIPYAVFSLVPKSILKDAPDCLAFHDLSPFIEKRDILRKDFLESIKKLMGASTSPVAFLPSEDGGLRLLNEWRDDFLQFGEFPRARALKMGGVDKAEVIEKLDASGLSNLSGQALIINSPSEANLVFESLGSDAVFKPALKPLSMDLSGLGRHGVKVITQTGIKEGRRNIIRRLENNWSVSERWIAQPRLRIGPGLERSVCATRGAQTYACQVTEQAKYPRMGGTALWVKTEEKTDLTAAASSLLQALDVIGICEASYLPDKQNHYQLIELNTRPWLQVGLMEFAGFPIIEKTVSALHLREDHSGPIKVTPSDWIHPERTVLALISGQLTIREFLCASASSLRKNTMLSGYNSKFPGMKARLATRSIRRLLS